MPIVDVTVDYLLSQRSAAAVGGARVPGGAPIVPGSTIKGRLRWTAGRLAAAFGLPACADPARCRLDRSCSVCSLFGNPRVHAPFAWSHAELSPDLLALADGQGALPHDTRVRLLRGGQACDWQTTLLAPDGLVYVGRIDGQIAFADAPAADDRDVPLPAPLLLLVASLQATEALGAGTTVGLGAMRFALLGVRVGAVRLSPEAALGQLSRLNSE